MAGYIGREINYGDAVVNHFTGNGGATYTLTHDTIQNSIVVSLDGVIQKNGTDFTVNNLVLTFTTNVTSGVAIQVIYLGLTASVGTVANSAITTAKIADGAITAAKIADGTIVAAEIAADAIDGTKIADDAINSEHYTDGSIDTAHIADNAVTGGKIAMTSDARGDILYYNGTDYARLAKGSSGTVLKMGANDPAWGTDTAGADLDTANTFTKGQRGEITALSDGSTITPDFNDSNNFSVTLGGNRTLANPSNLTVGQSGSIFVTQDGTGSRTLAYGSYWDFAGGTVPTLTTTASAVDRIDYVVRTTGSIHAVATLEFS